MLNQRPTKRCIWPEYRRMGQIHARGTGSVFGHPESVSFDQFTQRQRIRNSLTLFFPSLYSVMAATMILRMKHQMHDRQPHLVSGEQLLREGRSEREYYSGKGLLRPIHRVGFLLFGIVFVAFTIGIVVAVLPSLRGAGIFIQCLMLALLLGWFLLLFPLGSRMIRSALVSPSESDDDQVDSETRTNGPGSHQQ